MAVGSNPKKTMKCGEVRASTRPGKKVMKKYCLPGGKEKLVHAGAKGGGGTPSPTLWWPRCGQPPSCLGNDLPRLTFSLSPLRSRQPQGYGNNYSSKARASFKARHHCETAKPGSARHLACTVLWKRGGRKTSNPRGRQGKY